MEMMTMMMDLDKLPDPFSPSDLNFSGAGSSTSNHQPIYCPGTPATIPAPQFSNSGKFPRASWLQQKPDSVEAMREMIFRMAALQPVQIDPESVKPPKRRNVKISKDPQSVAARHRREKISERIRILQRLVPGGTKMDTASMLDEAVHYMKFLKKQVQSLEQAAAGGGGGGAGGGFPATGINGVSFCPTATVNHHGGINYTSVIRACGEPAAHMVGSVELLK